MPRLPIVVARTRSKKWNSSNHRKRHKVKQRPFSFSWNHFILFLNAENVLRTSYFATSRGDTCLPLPFPSYITHTYSLLTLLSTASIMLSACMLGSIIRCLFTFTFMVKSRSLSNTASSCWPLTKSVKPASLQIKEKVDVFFSYLY